jgi:hypothetical protein
MQACGDAIDEEATQDCLLRVQDLDIRSAPLKSQEPPNSRFMSSVQDSLDLGLQISDQGQAAPKAN